MLEVDYYGSHLSLRRSKTEFGSPRDRRISLSISVTAQGQRAGAVFRREHWYFVIFMQDLFETMEKMCVIGEDSYQMH
jgi:hypothetical protein